MQIPDELMELATELFGGREEAEAWFRQPAMALDRRVPIDLMATPEGAELVKQLLGRLDYSVYV